MINLNNGHTALSPGGVWGERTEYKECRRLISAISENLTGLPVKITEGREGYCRDGLLFIFHKGTSMKNAPKRGAEIIVSENASSDTQYDAFRLLCAVSGENTFRNKGVHTLTKKSPFKSLQLLENENAYLIKAGYIDSDRDNAVWDRELEGMARALSREIIRIYKEKINENYS